MTDARGRADSVSVRVFANEVDGDVVFTHDWSANGGPFEDPPVRLPRGRPDWDLTYRLYDRTGRNLQFPGDAEDAMWVIVSSKKQCPTGKANGSGHVSFGNVSSTGPHGRRDMLTVSDDNRGAACTLQYMLRFDPDPEEYKYDPVITNGGTN
jgi:hypothetical protein